MKFLSVEEIRKWCITRGLRIGSRDFLYYDGRTEHCFSVGLEEKPSAVIALANYLVPTWEDGPVFEGALLWIRERGVWSDYSEHVGEMIVRQMSLGKGGVEPLEARPGFYFGPQELFEMHSYLLIPMLVGWDAFLVPESEEYFLFVSHDGVVGVISRTQQKSEQLHKRVLDWNPREDRAWYFHGRD